MLFEIRNYHFNPDLLAEAQSYMATNSVRPAGEKAMPFGNVSSFVTSGARG